MITVTSPTSQIGSQVLDRLLGHTELRVLARRPERLPARVREEVTVIAGSHSDPDALRQALTGSDTLFWLVPPDPQADSAEAHYLRFADALTEAAVDSGRRRVVAVSSLGRGYAGRSGLLGAAFGMDSAIEATGVHYRALRMPYFMENLLGQLRPLAADGVLTFTNRLDRPLATVATRDIADVAARTLLDAGWTGQGSVPVVGPDDLSPDAMAAVVSDALGRDVRAEQVPHDRFAANLARYGVGDAWTNGILDMSSAQDDGIYDGEAGSSPRQPTTFARWCFDTLVPAVPSAGKPTH